MIHLKLRQTTAFKVRIKNGGKILRMSSRSLIPDSNLKMLLKDKKMQVKILVMLHRSGGSGVLRRAQAWLDWSNGSAGQWGGDNCVSAWYRATGPGVSAPLNDLWNCVNQTKSHPENKVFICIQQRAA